MSGRQGQSDRLVILWCGVSSRYTNLCRLVLQPSDIILEYRPAACLRTSKNRN